MAGSKFKDTPGFRNKIKGHILLQDHNTKVWFRNLKLRELSDKLSALNLCFTFSVTRLADAIQEIGSDLLDPRIGSERRGVN